MPTLDGACPGRHTGCMELSLLVVLAAVAAVALVAVVVVAVALATRSRRRAPEGQRQALHDEAARLQAQTRAQTDAAARSAEISRGAGGF